GRAELAEGLLGRGRYGVLDSAGGDVAVDGQHVAVPLLPGHAQRVGKQRQLARVVARRPASRLRRTPLTTEIPLEHLDQPGLQLQADSLAWQDDGLPQFLA